MAGTLDQTDSRVAPFLLMRRVMLAVRRQHELRKD
jgi:hypothetical protein